jgi:hypothetical protein
MKPASKTPTRDRDRTTETPPAPSASRVRTWRSRRSPVPVTETAPVRSSDTHVTSAQAPLRVGIDAQKPDSMPRAEDDAATQAGSREFHDRPGSGKDTARRLLFF